MPVDLFICNGKIVTEDESFYGAVAVNEGRIKQVIHGDAAIDANEVINLRGRVLMAGAVDAHVHWNQPGRTDWEGYRHGSMAAAAGGVTTALEMPLNATPATVDGASLQLKRDAVRGESLIDYALWGGLVDNNLASLGELHDGGVIGYKAFMSRTGSDDFKRVDDDVLYAGMQQVAGWHGVVGVHCENERVTAFLAQQLREAGRTDPLAWAESRPPATEWEAIERACFWARSSGARLHIVHVSTAGGVETALRARQSGAHVTIETCPHYLLLDHDDLARIGPAAKCAPPLRTRADVEALWECVLDGKVDTIGSDHSPCPLEDKERGRNDIWEAWGGISGIQTMLPLLVSEGIHRRGMTWERLSQLLSANPAQIFGLYPQKGALHPGSDADFVIIDPERRWTLTAENLFSRHKHSPFIGCEFRGGVDLTFVRGHTVYEHGRIVATPGHGQLLTHSV